MVSQYPHLLVFQSIGPESVQDDEGHWSTPDAGSTTYQHKCRAEVVPNGQSGGVIKSADGQDLVFSWIVYAPKDCPDIPEGSAVTIMDGTQVRAFGTAKRFVPGQLSVRLWL